MSISYAIGKASYVKSGLLSFDFALFVILTSDTLTWYESTRCFTYIQGTCLLTSQWRQLNASWKSRAIRDAASPRSVPSTWISRITFNASVILCGIACSKYNTHNTAERHSQANAIPFHQYERDIIIRGGHWSVTTYSFTGGKTA